MTVGSIVQGGGAVQSAIATAARATGIDFGYLLGQAKLESGLNAGARAGTSSASGLYQFIEQSWLAVVKKHGPEHGLGWAANAIQSGAGGRLTVTDPSTRQAILSLRNDAGTASLMAASYASDNKASLESSLGRTATGTDLYIAHFLGLGGAHKFLSTMASAPGTSAAGLFPAAAQANHNVFYASDGSARSLSDIYQRFAGKLGAAAGGVASSVGTAVSTALTDGMEVVSGAGQSASDAVAWAQSTLGQLKTAAGSTASLLRPTPDTARLAYLLLAGLGG